MHTMYNMIWPYPIEYGQEERISADVVVLGGGIAGCMAAIAAARKGRSVVLVEKGATKRSGSGGSGCDHWESATTNPCSKITPEELTAAMLDDNDGYNNGISHYIECREGYDRLLDIEAMGGKIRDTDDEFKGAEFRDEQTKLLFAYDYDTRYTIRIWGTTFKPAMYKELKRLGVRIFDRVMITGLLNEGGKAGARIVGATGIHTRTGKFYVFAAKASVLSMSRPARVWLYSPGLTGLCEFRPPQCVGDAHAMGWRAGVEFTMMEKSVQAEFSAAGRSYPPYGAGNNHNTWYAVSMVDAEGREIPYVDRDGNLLKTVSERYHPVPGQKYFLKGGGIDNPKYAFTGPETISAEELLKKGYRLPFFADLTSLPEMERKAIWGLMVGQEGKTQYPIYKNYTEAGFDPKRDLLQCYGTGWTSASFLPQERQLFGLPGGILNDWELQTNLTGLYVAGDSLFGADCFGHAAATGYYAGRHAAQYAAGAVDSSIDENQVKAEKERVYAPIHQNAMTGISWGELNMGVAKMMQNYCGDVKSDDLLHIGQSRLRDFERYAVPEVYARNPHELVRALEVFDILTVAQIIISSCLARKSSSRALCFSRAEDTRLDPHEDRRFIVVSQQEGKTRVRYLPLNYFGNLAENYERHNSDYVGGNKR